MVVKRVSDIDIHHRNFITAIEGNIDDSFVDEDLCSYTFEHQLYLYLKNEGYDKIYFYNRKENLYSYDNVSLDSFPSIKSGIKVGHPYFHISNLKDTSLIDTIDDILKNYTTKSVIYITSLSFSISDHERFIDIIASAMNEAAVAKSDNKILINRNSEGVFDVSFFTNQFKSLENVFTVGYPDKKECENWVNAARINNIIDAKTIFDFPYDIFVNQIYCQHKRIDSINTELNLNRDGFINSLYVEEFSEELLARSLSNIHGQQDNIAVMVREVTTWVNRPDEYKTPLVFMFAGTSGTGKTYTAEMISAALKVHGYEFVKLPMNEYKSEADVMKLLGSPAGHVDSDKDTALIAAHRKSDKLVILFDEIEKAHPSLFDTIMTLMEKGELSNGIGEKFDFRQSIIIFTTNLAMDKLTHRKNELQKANIEIDSDQFQRSIKDILKQNNVKPAICGRIDSVFVYNTLDSNVVVRIAIEEIRKLGLVYNLRINNIPEKLLHEIVMQVWGSNEGARPIKKAVAKKMEKALQSIKKKQ